MLLKIVAVAVAEVGIGRRNVQRTRSAEVARMAIQNLEDEEAVPEEDFPGRGHIHHTMRAVVWVSEDIIHRGLLEEFATAMDIGEQAATSHNVGWVVTHQG